MLVRKHIYFYGRVQGVGFRWRAMQIAKDLHMTGWVKNLYNGSVEMEVQGDRYLIEQMIRELETARFIQIERKEMIQIPIDESEGEFSVRG